MRDIIVTMPRNRRSSRRSAPQARILLRLPGDVHRQVARDAAAAGLSANEYCVRRLRTPGSPRLLDDDAQRLVERATSLLAESLVGLVLHGSFARDELREASDVDVLVVAEQTVPLTRAWYREWDATPLTWNARPVDAHLVHLPDTPDRAGGVWCEAAVEGLVLLDREGRVDAALRRVRRAIVAGGLVRKQAHGQPYWTKVA